MNDQRWVRLERANDWGSVYYRLPGWDGSANKQTQAVQFKPVIWVRWANGEVTDARIVETHHTENVSDHGNAYQVTTAVPRIAFRSAPIVHNGVPVHDGRHTIAIEDVEVARHSLVVAPEPD
jgi:hypothetical protein